MYTILIVDDERNERDGLEKLIRRYQYDLKILQAENGEAALKVFGKNDIDILLTDIKMPFMTGMELIEQVHKGGWNPVCIIYSAYGEFEYAQNAIALGVLQYLLKPIRLEEFQNLFQRVINVCDERKKREQERLLIKEEKKQSSREKIGREIIRYLESETDDRMDFYKKEFFGHEVYPVILSNNLYLFSRHWDEYVYEIKRIFTESTLIINRDDTQVLLLIPSMEKPHKKDVLLACEELISISQARYQSDIFIIVGQPCTDIGQIKLEYEKMKDQIDYQFFITGSKCLIDDQGAFLKKEKDMLPVYFKKILTCVKLKDFQAMGEEFRKAFEYVEENIGFSSIYIKYNFSEIIKKCYESVGNEVQMMKSLENIYEARTLEEMKAVVEDIVQEFFKEEGKTGSDNRVVGLVMDIIKQDYGNSTLSVALLAEKIGISAAYLSTLFKMEMGENLAKYISRYRIEKAKELLDTTNMKISDIAERVGYFNVSYFISLFHMNVGCSPSKYREKTKGNGQTEEIF